MKKFLIIILFACIATSAANAQEGVRIGNMKIIIKKNVQDEDTTLQVMMDEPCPPCPSENETRPKRRKDKYHTSSFFAGVGFILPDYGNDYYTVLGGNSINIDVGWLHRYQITRWFSLGGTVQYSYYNYKLRDAASDPAFSAEVIEAIVDPKDIDKQVYRSNNIAASVFTRFYLAPAQWHKNNDGMYVDLGVQGDFAFSKFYKLNTDSHGKEKYHDNYAFNPFNASAFARIGWDWFAVFARYRFTDMYNKRALPIDLPPITIGIQLF